MILLRRIRHLGSWLAVLAILVASLAPTLSQAFGTGAAQGWIEVCSAAGSRWIASDAGVSDTAPATSDEHPLAHCPYCHIHADGGLPAPGDALTLLLQGLSEARPPAFLQAPRTLHAWLSAQPRAPPASS